MSSRHLVFLYGTLRQDKANHYRLLDPANGEARFLGLATTVEKYPLVIASRYNIPYLLAAPGHGKVRCKPYNAWCCYSWSTKLKSALFVHLFIILLINWFIYLFINYYFNIDLFNFFLLSSVGECYIAYLAWNNPGQVQYFEPLVVVLAHSINKLFRIKRRPRAQS